MTLLKRYPGIYFWAGIVAYVVASDETLVQIIKKPTMSRTLGEGLRHPLLGPVLAGAWMGLTYHLLISEILDADGVQ